MEAPENADEFPRGIIHRKATGRGCHADGKGYNVILQALPIDGKLVLRVPKSDEEESRPPARRDDHREKSGQRRR
jgi:hypothetical protein